jgi:CubicO group peptidase (beta-lactamase class C family)
MLTIVNTPSHSSAPRAFKRAADIRTRLVRLFGALAAAVLVAATAAPALRPHAAAPALDFAEIDSVISGLMKTYFVPGAAIALVKDGQVIYTKGYGYRDVGAKLPVTDKTVFSIGSVTKSFTALGILQLVDAGKIKLDDPVVKYVPEFKLADPDATKWILIRHILAQDSGIPSTDRLEVESRAAIISDAAQVKPTAAPGKLWQYANINYVLAGAVIEKVTGQSWESYIQANVFAPLGMNNATFNAEELVKKPEFAYPYGFDILNDFKKGDFAETNYRWMRFNGPAGSIMADVSDMARYIQFQLSSGTVNGKAVVSKDLLTLAHTAQIPLAGTSAGDSIAKFTLGDNDGYGFGWTTQTYRGHTIVDHNGSIKGFLAMAAFAPADGVGMVVLTNTEADVFVQAVNIALMERLIGLNPTPAIGEVFAKQAGVDLQAFAAQVAKARAFKPDQAMLDGLAGSYDAGGATLAITAAPGMLHAASPLFGEIELIPIDAETFYQNGTLFGYLFTLKYDENKVATIYQQGQEVAKRAK